MRGVKKKVFKVAAVAVIGILLVFAAGCSGDLLGYIKYLFQGGVIDLPKTGQTTSDEPGDDGDLQMGVAWPVPRFTDNSNGTITDNLTGLIWLKDSTRFGQKEWADALSACNGLEDDGTDLTDGSSTGDWRLPNLNELESLINAGQVNPNVWLNDQGFSSVEAGRYWSSTTRKTFDSEACYVDMVDGDVWVYSKGSTYNVLAVRSGQVGGAVSLPRTGQTTSYASGDDGDLQKGAAWPDPRFTDIGNGTICDYLTGLMWEQAPSGASSWGGALSYANNLDLGGHSDWRLPNRKELRSLVNYENGYVSDWLEEQGFTGLELENYWSSTTYVPNNNNAWYVYMYNGPVQNTAKGGSLYVLAVRGGQ